MRAAANSGVEQKQPALLLDVARGARAVAVGEPREARDPGTAFFFFFGSVGFGSVGAGGGGAGWDGKWNVSREESEEVEEKRWNIGK
jgi:hypothetical protein